MFRKKILKTYLEEGNIIPIFLDWRSQENLRGYAVLLERLKDKEDQEDIKEYELLETKIRGKKVSIINSYQKWIIRFTTGPQKGLKTQVNISYFKRSEGIDIDNEYN
jgi:hypothetical protein